MYSCVHFRSEESGRSVRQKHDGGGEIGGLTAMVCRKVIDNLLETELQSCKGSLKCDVTMNTINGSQAVSRLCDSSEDACLR